MKNKRASGIAQLALCVAATAVLTACGGGSSGDSAHPIRGRGHGP